MNNVPGSMIYFGYSESLIQFLKTGDCSKDIHAGHNLCEVLGSRDIMFGVSKI